MTAWRKSSFSHTNGCVEVAMEWRKSSASSSTGQCVEAMAADGVILVRDSKQGESSPILHFTRPEFRAFVWGVKAGEFDDLAGIDD